MNIPSLILRVNGGEPQISPEAFVAPGAVITGDVTVAPLASIWFGSVVRGDVEPIVIGQSVNVQDGAVLHTERGAPLVVADHVAIAHRAVVHGCTLEPEVLVGIGAIVLSRARIGRGSIIGAGAVVLEDAEIPPNSLVVGIPGEVVGRASGQIARGVCDRYVMHADRYRAALLMS